MKKNFKKISLICLVTILVISLFCGSIVANATDVHSDDVPYQSYTYWYDSDSTGELVYSKAMYYVKETVTPRKLGIEAFSLITDMCIGPDGYIYLTDADAHSLTILDSKYNFVKKISEFTYGGKKITLTKVSGVYVHNNGDIYLCDSDAGMILVTDKNGNISKIIESPDKENLPEQFTYRPLKVAVDADGYTYVLSDGSYYGALLFAPEGSFIGFYGANSVKGGIIHALSNIWNRLTMTNEKRANSIKSLPFVFTDLCIDNGGFVYTATGRTEHGLQKGAIRRLSPGGINILGSEDVVFGETEMGRTSAGTALAQDFSGLTVDDDGFIFTYDRTLGNIYMYDNECTLITAFGGGVGLGKQDGTFQVPCAIDFYGEDIYVCDTATQKITIFAPTQYGKLVRSLQQKTLEGTYSETIQGWKEVIAQDKNCQIAYKGLSKAALLEKDYETALEYARIGDDRDTYAQAWEYMRGVWLNKNFVFIFCGALILAAAVVVLLVYKKKNQIVLIKNREVKLSLETMLHPVNTFNEIKEKKRGNVIICLVILTLFYISEIARNDLSGFLFAPSGSSAFNSLVILARSVGAVVIWTASNWLVSTLFGGLGKIKNIFIVTCYSITPLIVANVVYTVLSNFLIPSEAAFMSLMITIAQLFMIFILSIGTMIIHDFSFGKFVLTALLSILGLLIIVFMIAATIILVQQIGSFFATLFFEIIFR